MGIEPEDIMWRKIQELFAEIEEEEDVADFSLKRKKQFVKQLGLVVSSEMMASEDDEPLDELINEVYQIYKTTPLLFQAIYTSTPYTKTIPTKQLTNFQSWFGKIACLYLESNTERVQELKAEEKAMYDVLQVTPLVFNTMVVMDISQVIDCFQNRFDVKLSLANKQSNFDFIMDMIKKRSLELKDPIPEEAKQLADEIETLDLDDLNGSELRAMCERIYQVRTKMSTNISFDWEKLQKEQQKKPKDCKLYMQAFVNRIRTFNTTVQDIKEFVQTEMASIGNEESSTSVLNIDETLIIVKPLSISEKSQFSIVSVGVRYDCLYEKQKNKIVRSDDPKKAKPIDQLLFKSSSIKIQTRDMTVIVNLSDIMKTKFTKEPRKGVKIPCLPTVSYDSTVPFYRLLLYVTNANDQTKDICNQLSLLDRPFMISEDDLLALFKEKMHLEGIVDHIANAKIIYNVPVDVLKIFDFTKKAEVYFREMINAKGPNTNETKEVFIQMLTTSKTIAFLKKSEIEILGSLVSVTKHVFKDQSVESCNLENIIGVINKMKSQSSTNFLLIRITGTLSPTELSRLYNSACDGTTRLIFVATPSLINAAQVSGRYSDVIVSKTINTDNNIHRTNFTKKGILNRIFEKSTEIGLYAPEVLDQLIEDYLPFILQENQERIEWREKERDWREKRKDDQMLFLINQHNNNYIKQYYLSMGATVVDPMRDTIHESVTEFINQVSNQNIFVVLESHKISEVDKKTVMRNFSRMPQMPCVIFVTEYYQPTDEIISIDTIGKSISFYSTEIYAAPEEFSCNSGLCERFYRVLSFLFPSFICKDILPKMINYKDEDVIKVIDVITKDIVDSSKSYLDQEASIMLEKSTEDLKLQLLQLVDKNSNTNSNKREANSSFCSNLFSLCWSATENRPFLDITFEQFNKEIPICQFLSQPLKIALWTKYFLKGKTSEVFNNLQTNFLLSNIVTNDYQTSDDVNAHCYLVTKPDIQVHFDQLSITQIHKKEDIDWNNSNGLEFIIDSELNIMKILQGYPFSLKFLLSIPVNTVYNVLNEAASTCTNSNGLRIQLKQLSCMIQNEPIFEEHRAVIHWVLAFSSDELHILTADDISIMIRMKLKLTNIKALQKKVMPVVLSLNGSTGLLSTDLDIKHHLLTEPVANYCSSFDSFKLGSETIHFLFNPSNWNSLGANDTECILNNSHLKCLYKYIKEPSEYLHFENESEWSDLVSQQQHEELKGALNVLSESAVVALISKCSRKHQLFLLAYVLRESSLAQSILMMTCQLVNFELKYYFLDSLVMMSNSIDLGLLGKKIDDPVCKQIVHSENVNFAEISKFYLEYSGVIRKSVIDNTVHFSITELYDLFIEKTTPTGCYILFRELSNKADQYRPLMLVCWLLGAYHNNIQVESNDAVLLHQLFSMPKVKKSFSAVTDNLSDLIKYFLFPSLLSENSFSEFARIFGQEQIQSTFKTLCQIENSTYPPYSCEFFRRSLPTEFIKYLDDELSNWKPKQEKISFHFITMDTDGISVEKVKMNLQCIFDAKYNNSEHKPTSDFIVNFLLSWFFCAGISYEQVYKWLGKPAENPIDMSDHQFKQVTLYPFPSFISLQVLTGTKYILFGKTKEDVVYTIRQLNSLVSPDKQVDPSKFLIEKNDRFGRSVFVPSPSYSNVLVRKYIEDLAISTKKAVISTLNSKTTQKSYFFGGTGNSYSIKILQSVLRPLTRLLQEIVSLKNIVTPQLGNAPMSGVMQVRVILSYFLSFFNDKISQENSVKTLQALLFKGIFSLFGIIAGSPQSNNLMDVLLKEFHSNKMEICQKSFQEIKWMNDHHFISVPDLQTYKSQTNIESESGELLYYSKLGGIDYGIKTLTTASLFQQKEIRQANDCLLDNHYPKMPVSNQLFYNISSENKELIRSLDEQYTESFLRPENTTPSTIDVSGFIEIDSHEYSGEMVFATVRVIPGNTCCIVKLKNRPFMKVLKENSLGTEENTDVEKVVATFSSHEFLWNTLQQYPVGSLLFSNSGFALSRTETSWNIFFNLTENQRIEKFYPVWRIIYASGILNNSMDESVYEFMIAVCRIIAKNSGIDVNQNTDSEVVEMLCSIETSSNGPSLIELARTIQQDLKKYVDSFQDQLIHDITSLTDQSDVDFVTNSMKFRFNKTKCSQASEILKGDSDHPVLSNAFAEKSLRLVKQLQTLEKNPLSGVTQLDFKSDSNKTLQCNSLEGNNPQYILFLNVPFEYPILKYERSYGIDVGFIVNSSVLVSAGDTVEAYLSWLTVVLISSLPLTTKMKVLQYFYTEFIHQDISYLLTPNLKVMFYSLAKKCPIIKKGEILKQAVDIIYDHMLTKQSNYAIHFVSCQGTVDIVQQLKEMMDIELLDFTDYYENGSLSLPQTYLSIIEPFCRKKCGVYVKGLKTIEDSLLKWCAEFTKDVPWAYIYFEEPITTYNLPENLDRCFIQKEYARQILHNHDRQTRNTFVMSYNRQDKPVLGNKVSKFRSDWKQAIGILAADPKERWILISGPPGLGKSYHFEQKKIVANYYFDGSKDILVRTSLVDILENNTKPLIKQDTTEFIVVIDEYHMLSESHKRQLFSWAKKNTLIKLILISNRHDISDRKLLELYFGYSNVDNNIIHCSGKFDEMKTNLCNTEDYVTSGSKSRRLFRALYLWYHSTRNLFGEEMMTYRIFKHVSDCLGTAMDKNNNEKEIDELATTLQKKQPSFTKEFCCHYVKIFFEFFKKEEEFINQKTKTFEELDQRFVDEFNKCDTSYMTLLVGTSLLITKDQSNLAFPEFSNNIEYEYQYHVIVRMMLFIEYMCELKGIHLTTDQLEKFQTLLLRCKVVDKPSSFPQLSTSLETQILTSCEVECVKVDFNNLEVVHQMLIRGYAIDFHQASLFWRKKPIQNPKQFEKIVSAYPPVSQFVSSENIFSLLKRSPDASLCRYMLQEDNSMNPKNCFYLACWKLYKEELLLPEFSYKEKSRMFEVTKIPDQHKLQVDKLQLIVWVSKFGRSLLDVSGDLTVFEREFVAELYFLSNSVDIENTADMKGLCEIWSGLFSFHLKVSSKLHNQPNDLRAIDLSNQLVPNLQGLSLTHIIYIAQQFYPPLPEWDYLVQIVSRLWYNPCDSVKELELLTSYDDFWTCLESERTASLLECFVLSPGLTLKMKIRILMSPFTINIASELLADVVQNFGEALQQLENRKIAIKTSLFLEKCKEYKSNEQ